ncbi:MAG TPA: hypothetical protein DEV87_07110 [Clostridiales bacterium]|nr:hypothetical protein [Clostridiales bacterium]
MQKEKKKILQHRIIWSIILMLTIIIDFIVIKKYNKDFYPIGTSIAILITIVPLSLFISTLLLSYKTYMYNDKEIIVYAGFYHHYISVSGVKTDEHNTIISYTPITLTCTLSEGARIQATISLTNRIALKINDKLYQEVR